MLFDPFRFFTTLSNIKSPCHFYKLIMGNFQVFLEGKINFEYFPTLSFSSSQGHNLVNFLPKSTSRTTFEHLSPWPFYPYQQKRSFWLYNLPKRWLKKSPSLYATYCNFHSFLFKNSFLTFKLVTLFSNYFKVDFRDTNFPKKCFNMYDGGQSFKILSYITVFLFLSYTKCHMVLYLLATLV